MPQSIGKPGSKKQRDKHASSSKKDKSRSEKKKYNDVFNDNQTFSGIKNKKSKLKKDSTSAHSKEASVIMPNTEKKSGKNKDIIPCLKLSKEMLNKMKNVVAEYHVAAKYLEEMEDDDDIDPRNSEEGESSDKSGESTDGGEDTEDNDKGKATAVEDLEDDELIAAYDAFAIEESDEDDTSSALESDPERSAHVELPTPAQPIKSQLIDNQSLEWLTSIGFPTPISLDALKKCNGNKLDALEWIYRYAWKIEEVAEASVPNGADLEAILEEEAMTLDSIYSTKFRRSCDVWEVEVAYKVPVSNQKICRFYNLGNCRFGDSCKLIHIPSNKATMILQFYMQPPYPFKAPLITLRQADTPKLPLSCRLALNLQLYGLSRTIWLNSPMVQNVVDWLTSSDAIDEVDTRIKSILNYNPDSDKARLFIDNIPSKYESRQGENHRNVEGLTMKLGLSELDARSKPILVGSSETSEEETSNDEDDMFDEYNDLAYDAFEDDFTIDVKPGKTRNQKKPNDLNKAINVTAEKFSTNFERQEASSSIDTKNIVERLARIAIHDEEWEAPTGIKPLFSRASKQLPCKNYIQRSSTQLLAEFNLMVKQSKYHEMKIQREQLPAFHLKTEIVNTINSNRVTVISGETGCGKTTQVPQFIFEDYVQNGEGGKCKILITQPRRISAIGVSERVAAERLGKLGDTVGYQIRMESKMSAKTRILYCTTGILLRRLEGGAINDEDGIHDISHIIVDEVHERSIESDFLMMVLKHVLELRKDLKVVLMSATLNAEMFQSYFGGESIPLLHIPGRTFPVHTLYLEDALAITRYSPPAHPKYSRRSIAKPKAGSLATRPSSGTDDSDKRHNVREDERPDEDLSVEQLQKRYPNLGNKGANTLAMMNTEAIQYPLIESLILWIVPQLIGSNVNNNVPGAHGSGKAGRGSRRRKGCTMNPPVDSTAIKPNRGILIFLPGIEEIAILRDILMHHSLLLGVTANGKYILPVHGILSSNQQARAFERPPENEPIVKIIIATNVAETSITIDDIVYVIDSGKMKETRWDANKGMESLEECWVSKANAIQRRGRAGRVSAGTSIHLFTSNRFEKELTAEQLPEIKRTPLEQLCLRIKVLPLLEGPIHNILATVIEPPSPEAISAAISCLRSLRALNMYEKLTPLGFHLAQLPVNVRIGKLILFGSIFGCLDKILTIAATMSHQTPFVFPFEKRHIANESKRQFALGSSDHLTTLLAYEEWQQVKSEGIWAKELDFLYHNFLDGKTLNMIAGIKRQLLELLSMIGFAPPNLFTRDLEQRGGRNSDGVAETLRDTDYVKRSDNMELVKAVLVAGLYPNVVKVRQPYKEGVKKGKGGIVKRGEISLIYRGGVEVYLHPTSVNAQARLSTPFLVFLEKIKTSKVFLRDSTCISPYALVIFGGKLALQKGQNLVMEDGWIRFLASKKVSMALEAAREALDELLTRKIENPKLKITNIKLIDVLVQLVAANG